MIWLFENPNFYFYIDYNIAPYHKKWQCTLQKKTTVLFMNQLKPSLKHELWYSSPIYKLLVALSGGRSGWDWGTLKGDLPCWHYLSANYTTFQGMLFFPFPPLFFLIFQDPIKLNLVKQEIRASFVCLLFHYGWWC